MQNKSSLLSGVALGVLLAATIGQAAEAKPHHHHAAAAVNSDLAAKVESLTNAVGDLEGRLNDETQARQATQAEAEAAKADAAAARAEAAAAQNQLAEQIQTIPGQVNSAVAANKPKPSWADNTHVSATFFGDLSNINQTPHKNNINGTGFDIKRAYFGVDHSFNSIYSANLTVDLAPTGIILNGNGATVGKGLQGSEVVKYAYVQAHYFDALILQAGSAKTPWIPFVEDLYGYRYIDKVMVDQNKFGNSADWGINAHGDFGKGLLDYSVSVVDGDGYKVPQRSQTMDFEGRVNVNYKGFVAAIGGASGEESQDIQVTGPTVVTANRLDALVAYTNSKFRIGGEYFQATDWKVNLITATTAAKQDRSQGYSVFASYNITPKWSVFGRYDMLDPSQKLAASERYDYYNIGVGYEPVKTLDLALVYKHEDVNHAPVGGYTDATTTLAPLGGKANFDEVGLYTQFKF